MYDSHLLRIGIFYDGNYFYHVSNYYCYAHERRSRLSISGLHDFIKRLAGRFEGVESKFCQIVDCHYFRGRLPAMEANARQILLNERMFDDILMREGVVTHYLPVTRGGEKGVDVCLALEALELNIFKKFDVVALIASDGDYVPLVRKLNALGTRVMVLGWDFEYIDDNGNERYTATSGKMMNEVTYPIWMHKVIDGQDGRFEANEVNALFVPSGLRDSSGCSKEELKNGRDEGYGHSTPNYDEVQPDSSRGAHYGVDDSSDSMQTVVPEAPEGRRCSRILQLKNGYGFLSNEPSPKNLFFFWEDLEGIDFNELNVGDILEYEIGENERGECARHITRVSSQSDNL
jgi:cold-shock DNA-binding domain protein